MAASDASAPGGFLRGHSVAFALIAIFAGMALAVSYAASDGAIFGLGTSSSSDRGVVSNGSTGGAAVISRDSFEQESAPVEQNETSPPPTSPPESGTTLSEEERELLALSDFPWDSVAGSYIASNQDSMDRFRKPVPVQPGTDPLSISDAVVVNVDRARDVIEDEQDDFELADIIDIDIPIDTLEDGDQPSSDEQEQPQNDEEPQEGGNEDPDEDSSGEEPSDDSGSGDDGDQSQSGGNSTDTENSTSTQQETSDSGSGSEDSDGSGDTEATVTIE